MTTQIATIDSKETVKEIKQIQYRLEIANSQAKVMLEDLNAHKDEISKVEKDVKDKWYRKSPNNSELFELIKSDQKSNAQTTTSISNLIKGINSNTEDLAKMIQGLSMLAVMTYSDLKDIATEIEGVQDSQLSIGKKVGIGQNQMNDLIKLQIAKAKKEHEFETNIKNIVNGHIESVEKATILLNEFENRLEQVQFAKELSERLKKEKSEFETVKKDSLTKLENEWNEVRLHKNQIKKARISFVLSIFAVLVSLGAIAYTLLEKFQLI